MTNKPIPLRPIGKDYLWGGERLKNEYNKEELTLSPLAETWECSVHPEGESVVAAGKFKGRTLASVLEENPQFLGTKALERGEKSLPIMVKLIDAAQDLSVQVHPDDDYAQRVESERGKTEMWYVLDAKEDTKIVYGFEHVVTQDILRKAVESGTLSKHLHYTPVRKGDVFLIQAGTVHAIGAGALIAEIQENSNVTYRLYDYNRKDKEGRLRPLHLDRAVEVMNMMADRKRRAKVKERNVRYYPGYSRELLCRCRYFETELICLNGQCEIVVSDASFQVLLCTRGRGEIYSEGVAEPLAFQQGDCFFLPAGMGRLSVKGKAELLKVRC